MGNLITVGADLTPARLGGSWQDFAGPVWGAATTAPVLGNGAINARWRQDSTTVTYVGRILMGATTTYGAGAFTLNLPVPARDTLWHTGPALAFDANGPNRVLVAWLSGQSLRLSAENGDVGNTTPFTWAAGDQLRWRLEYEAA